MSQPPTAVAQSTQEALLGVLGALGTAVTVAVVVREEPVLAVGIAAGAGWMLAALLHLMARSQRTRLRELEDDVTALKSDLQDARRTAGEFSATSKAVSEACHTVLHTFPLAQPNPPARAVAPAAEPHENAEGPQ